MFVNFSCIFCLRKSALSVDKPFFSVTFDLRSLSLAPKMIAAVISALNGDLGFSVTCFVILVSNFFSAVAIAAGGGAGGGGGGGGGGGAGAGGAGISNDEGKSDVKLLSVINCLVYGSISGGGGMGGA